ncbi:hypothetical protein BYT27DRAFT_7255279 [Phlegmacium glaucopus]|nr:hypothetical protein BYT27DRAFT_7255279 [Phlegmacium glaucopus]
MARDPSILTSHQPTAIAPANVQIAHIQLRDLIICPRERGTVNYVQSRAIVEQNINISNAPTRTLSQLYFTPNSLTHLPVGVNDTLIAAGGQESEIHLSLHTPSSSRSNRTRQVWEFADQLGGSINNSVLLTSLSLTRANESSVEPRVGISNNDGSVKLYNIPMRIQNSRRKLPEVGKIKHDVPINHSSISPDGRTLLCVGDSNMVYFHHITGGAQVTFSPITTLSIPPPDPSPGSYLTSSLAASFSTAFSSDGSKFAVASQEGVVAVWDVRSTLKPIKVFQTDKTRVPGGSSGGFVGNGGATGWLSDDPWEWTRGNKAPGWCVRNVKFNGGEGARLGKEIMAFTEHTSFIHIVDARTFEVDETIRVPTIHKMTHSSPLLSPTSPASPPPDAPTSSRVRPIQLSRRGRMSTGGRAPRRPSTLENDTGMNQNYMLTVPPTSSIRHSVSGSPSPSTSTSLSGETRTGAATVASDSENPLEHLITTLRRRPTSVLAPGGHLRPNSVDNTTSPASPSPPVSDFQLHAQHSQPHSSSSTSNSVVQALGDAFRVPISGYSAPASIGDSTWRTLGFHGNTAGGGQGGTSRNTGSGSGTGGQRGIILGSAAPPTSPQQDDEIWTGDWSQSLGVLTPGDHDMDPIYLDDHQHDRERREDADDGEEEGERGILVIPSLGDRAVENDVHALLEVHGIASRLSNENGSSEDDFVERTAGSGQRPRPRRMRLPSYGFLEEEERERGNETIRDGGDLDADGEVDADVDDMNTGSSHGDYEYYLGGSSHRTRRRLIRQGLGYAEHGFGVEEEEEQGMDDRMDVDMDTDIGGGVEEDCESEESEDEDGNSTRTRNVIRQSPPASPMYSSISSRRYGTSPTSTSTAVASTSTGSTAASQQSSIAFPKINTQSGQNQTQNPAHNYGYGSLYGYYDDLDLAGLCFDPSGEKMYVAGMGLTAGGGNGGTNGVAAGAVVEWGVRGAEKRWWVEEKGWK